MRTSRAKCAAFRVIGKCIGKKPTPVISSGEGPDLSCLIPKSYEYSAPAVTYGWVGTTRPSRSE